MNAITSSTAHTSAKMRSMLAPLFIGWAAVQFWIGDLLLSAHPVQRGFTVAGSIGLVLVFSSVLIATIGIGEAGNALAQAFRKD